MTTKPSISDYRAAHEAALLLDAPPGAFFLLRGRAPAKMLQGLAAGETPPALQTTETGVQSGRAPSSVILTQKGRMVTEFRVARLGNGDESDLLLHLPGAEMEEALSHLAKFLPPRFAKVTQPESPVASFLLVGPGAPALLSMELFEARIATDELAGLLEGEERSLPDPSPVGIRVVRSGDFTLPAFEVVAEASLLTGLRRRLSFAGAVEASDPSIQDMLRLEKGRPRFGVEMDSETLPPEAGNQDRSIDHKKGCYTGQEVIVRIRDRGHVNRLLRGLLLGSVLPPEAGTPLFLPRKEGAVGEIRSAVVSPRFGQTIALGYLRREVDPTGEVRLGDPDGPPAQVRELTDSGWVLVEGDPLLYP